MTEVFHRVISGYNDTYRVANAIEGIDNCEIISINNLGNRQWEIRQAASVVNFTGTATRRISTRGANGKEECGGCL